MKPMSQLELFKMMNGPTKAFEKMQSIDFARDAVSPADLNDQLRLISRRMPFQMKGKVLDDVTKGRVIPVWAPGKLDLPVALNCFLWRDPRKGTPIAVVNLTHYASRAGAGGPFEVDVRTLFSLLQWGTVSLRCLEKWNRVTMSTPVLRRGAEAWVMQMSAILDRMYGISLHPMRMDLVCYMLAKYFLVCLMEKAPGSETVEGLARACAPNGTSGQTLQSMSVELVGETGLSSMSEFFRGLSNVDGMGALTVRALLEAHMKAYGEAGVLGMEYFPAFAASAFSSQTGGRVINDFAVEKAVGKEGVSLYVELDRALS
jgi:hypothetical protein